MRCFAASAAGGRIRAPAWTRLAVAVLACALPCAAQAQTEAVRLQDAVARVLQTHPKLQEHRYALAGADARRDQAALRPAYELSLNVENVLGTGQVAVADDMEATLALGTVLELGGKRDRRVFAADRERELLAVTQEAERLDILAETARRFFAVLAEQERLRLAVHGVDLAKRTVDFVGQRVSQGRASPVESANARLALSQVEIAVAEQQAAQRAAWASLASTWGGTIDGSGAAVGAIYDLPAARPYPVLAEAVARNPDIVRFAGERRVNEARLRLAEANRSPDVTASLGVRRLQATRDQAMVFAVSVPLGSGGRSAPYAREAQSRLEQGRYEEEAARRDLLATLYGLHQRLESARLAVVQLQAAALPEAEKAESLTEEGFRAGRFSLLELTVARQSLLGLRQQAVTAAATYHQLYLEIERLTGQSLAAAME